LARFDCPKILGILNVTEDSFSDGGRFLEPASAFVQAHEMFQAGADIIDVGAASSHPDARAVGPAQEITRLEAIVPQLKAASIPISIDSFEVEVQRWALAQNVEWLNDINGFPDPSIYDDLAASTCGLFVMHALQAKGIAQRVEGNADKIWDTIERFFDERLNALVRAGVAQERIVIDPGMGFFLGNMPDVSLRVLAELDRLSARYKLPVLISVTRKSFLRAHSGRDIEAIAPMSLAAELWATQMGANYIRTHDVAQLNDALSLHKTLYGMRP